ncbi:MULTISPECIES: hypothetical protein [Rhizobium]|uniref:Uncharacterized protein n=5 Tax=Rhizobium TaxID=379 RepID=A0A6P1CCR1_RHITR|nr:MULTISPECIES: hypothetical protein [Rhizobium]AGB73725.1 hypothetical protein RTCIAT899_PB02455 [Rhizobium tropici CIAT 899]ENN87148.1 hypothetical protein RHSP_79616 [Rhizobium freirei PRF 81]MBB4245053.1 hypothetical protein [Rhizobium tropici]MBB4569981.1 hypothetical protein [Rhizobium leucaenae]MBB5576336.1 hypothetical protein [Rhizobium paranaense]
MLPGRQRFNKPAEERSASARDRYNAWLDKIDGETLTKAKKEILRARARMTRAMFDIELAEAFRAESGIPAHHIDTLLHEECGLDHKHISVAQPGTVSFAIIILAFPH